MHPHPEKPDRPVLKWLGKNWKEILAVILALAGGGVVVDQVSGAGIEGRESYEPHHAVILEASDQADIYLWKFPDGIDYARCDGGRAVHVWAPPGTYTVHLTTLTIDWDARETAYDESRHTFTVGTPEPPTPPPSSADPAKATARLLTGRSGCTVTILGPRFDSGRWLALSAAHCVTSGDRSAVTLKDGRKYTGEVIARDTCADLAVLVIETTDQLPFALVAAEMPAVGDRVWHNGFGVHIPGNVEKGEITGHDECQTRMTLSVSSGDSGGGIFLEGTGEVVSVVCCTSRIGARVTMWGGHVNAIHAIVRKAKGTLADGDDRTFVPPAVEPHPGRPFVPPEELAIDGPRPE